MSYLVLAPLVLVRVPRVGDGDRIDYHYADSVIPALTDEQSEQFLSEGLVVELDDADVDPDAKPAHAAVKASWVDYAVRQGAARDEAEAMSKADLVELYG